MKKLISFVLLFMLLVTTQAQTLTEKEKVTMQYLREEEKLSGDVYDALYNQWGHQVFMRIPRSERHHMSMVKHLLDKYGVRDPVTTDNNLAGIFTDRELQKRYNDLVASGRRSLEGAFYTGALIEETSMQHLKDAITGTSKEDIKSTYVQLLQASQNHFRAFDRNLKRMGINYTPVFLSKGEYDQIISSSDTMQRGRVRMWQ